MSEITSETNKRIAKNTVYLYLRMIVLMLIALYTSRAFLDALGVDDYGIYNIVGGFVSLLALITGSMTMGAQRFISFAIGKKDPENLHRTFSTFTNLFLILAVTIFLIFGLMGHWVVYDLLNLPIGRLDAALFCYYCSLLAFSVNIIAIPYMAAVISHEKMDFYAMVSILESLLKLVIVYTLYTTSFDRLKVYACLLAIVGLVIRFIYGIYCSRNFPETTHCRSIDRKILKEAFFFTFWMAFGNAVVVAKEQGVNILINLFCGVAMNAARGISVQVSSVMSQFGNSIASAINPQITKSYASGNWNRSVNLTFLLTKAEGLMLLVIALPLYFEMNFLLEIWLNNVPYYAEVFAKWIVILSVLTPLRNCYGPLYMATGDVKTLQWSTSIIYILILPLSYVALKLGYEPVVTMQITAVIEVITWIASYCYIQYKFKFPLGRYIKETILPLILIASFSSVILYSIQIFLSVNNFWRFFLVCVVSVSLVTSLSYCFLLSKNEKAFVVRVVQSKLPRK